METIAAAAKTANLIMDLLPSSTHGQTCGSSESKTAVCGSAFPGDDEALITLWRLPLDEKINRRPCERRDP
jgi:hypothetical protein